MEFHSKTIFSLILLMLGLAHFQGAAQTTKPNPEVSKPSVLDPSGRWVGEYSAGQGPVSLVIRIKKDKDKWTGLYNRPLLDWEDQRELRSLNVVGDRISFDLGDGQSAIHADTRWRGNVLLRGKITGPGGRGKIVLEPSATIAKDYLDTLAGDYVAADGVSYVIQRENTYLCFLNKQTGRSGRLIPVSETEFWSGPTMDIYYPPIFRFEFVTANNGQHRYLKIKERGKEVLADRKELYRTQDVEFRNDQTKLSGTLFVPAGNGRRPAVVLLHGSNYQTRGGQYAALGFVADQFARNGFAALIYDKRGTGKSEGARDDDPDLLSGDAAAAVRLLRERPDVNPDKIGLWGISQGGIIEPIAAEKAGRIAFFINVSGAVVNTNLQEIQRTELELRADGFKASDVAAAVHLQEVKFHYACKRDNWDEYQTVLKAAEGKPWLPDPYIGPPDSKSSTAWDFWKCGVEPGKYWEHVLAPVLYVQGEFETNSSPRDNLARLQEAMKVAGNQHFEQKLMPGADHSMFKAARGGEKELPYLNTYVDGYFDLMTDWAKRQVEPK